MSRGTAAAALVTCVLGLLVAAPCRAADFPRLIPSPPSLWKIGDGWPLVVERHPPSGPPAGDGKTRDEAGPARYAMHVIVARVLQPQNQSHWQLDFLIPRKGDVPAGVEESYRMLVRQEDGSVDLVSREGAPANDNVREVGEVHTVAAAPDGFPMELFFEALDYEQNEFKNAQATLTIDRQAEGQTLTVEATYQPTGGEPIKVRQKWVQGEKWWRDYERYRGGRLELHAWLDLSPGAKAPREDARPPSPPTEPEDLAGLRQDARLQTPLTFDLKQGRFSELTDRIRKDTGVPLMLQEGLDRETPKIGSQSFRGVPAWMVMRQTAALVGTEARWEKDNNGYHLSGVWPPSPEPKRKSDPSATFRYWLTGVSLLGVIAVGGWFVYRRFRKKPATSQG